MAKSSWSRSRIRNFILGFAFIIAAGVALASIFLNAPGGDEKQRPFLKSTEITQIKFAHEGAADAVTGFRDRHVYLVNDPLAIRHIRKITNEASLKRQPTVTINKLCQAGDIYGLRFVYKDKTVDQFDPIKSCNGNLRGPLASADLETYFKSLETYVKAKGFEVDPSA